MTLDLFVPPREPTVTGTNVATKPRVNLVQFGDGYMQRSADGLNASPRTLSPQWSGLTVGEIDQLEAFFERHTVTAFRWNVPLDTRERRWIVTGWARGYVTPYLSSLSATFVEVFDL